MHHSYNDATSWSSVLFHHNKIASPFRQDFLLCILCQYKNSYHCFCLCSGTHTHTWGPFQKEGFQSSEFEPERRVAKTCNVQLMGLRTHVNSWFNELRLGVTLVQGELQSFISELQLTWFTMAISRKKPWWSHYSPRRWKIHDHIHWTCAYFQGEKAENYWLSPWLKKRKRGLVLSVLLIPHFNSIRVWAHRWSLDLTLTLKCLLNMRVSKFVYSEYVNFISIIANRKNVEVIQRLQLFNTTNVFQNCLSARVYESLTVALDICAPIVNL